MVVYGKFARHRIVQGGLIAVLLQPCIQVAGDTPVRQGIGTVGSDVYLDEPVALQMVILCGRSAYHSVVREHDDARMRAAYANLVLGTNHAQRLHTTQLRLLDYKLLVTVVEHATQIGYNHLLAGCYVGRSALNTLYFFECVDLQASRCQRIAHLLGCQVKVYVLL